VRLWAVRPIFGASGDIFEGFASRFEAKFLSLFTEIEKTFIPK